MPRRTKKAPGLATDRRNGQQYVIGAPAVERFAPPAGLSKRANQAWDDFWNDRPAVLLTPTSKVVLVRWIEALHRYERAIHEADLIPLVEGSHKQLMPNPLYRVAADALRTVEACEKQLGIGTLNATQLGLAAVAEQRQLSDLNARYEGPQDVENAAEVERLPASAKVVAGKVDRSDPRLLDG